MNWKYIRCFLDSQHLYCLKTSQKKFDNISGGLALLDKLPLLCDIVLLLIPLLLRNGRKCLGFDTAVEL